MAESTALSSANSSESINVSATPAVVELTGPDGATQFLSHSDPQSPLTFDIHFDASSNTAFFKLRVTVVLNALPHTQTSVYLFIPPERVLSLAHDESSSTPEEVRKKLSTDTTCLRFRLNRPAVRVVPLVRLAPKKKVYGDALDCVRGLAKETTLVIYLSHRVLSKTRLRALCNAASSSGLLKSSVRHADITRLYGGKGGQAIEEPGPDLGAVDVEGPPSYTEMGPAPPPPPFVTKEPSVGEVSKKRRRGSSDGGARSIDMSLFESICRKMIDEHKAEMRDQLLAEMRRDVVGQLEKLETRILDRVEQQLHEHAEQVRQTTSGNQEEVERRIEEVRDENKNMIDDQIEDGMLSIKVDLEDYVADEMRDAEYRIMDHLSSTSVSIQFNANASET